MAPFEYARRTERWSFALAVGLVWREMSLQRRGAHTWRHTATSFPCTATWSAGSTSGS